METEENQKLKFGMLIVYSIFEITVSLNGKLIPQKLERYHRIKKVVFMKSILFVLALMSFVYVNTSSAAQWTVNIRKINGKIAFDQQPKSGNRPAVDPVYVDANDIFQFVNTSGEDCLVVKSDGSALTRNIPSSKDQSFPSNVNNASGIWLSAKDMNLADSTKISCIQHRSDSGQIIVTH